MFLSLSPIQHRLVLDNSANMLFSSTEETLAKCPLIDRHSISDSSHVNSDSFSCFVMQNPSYMASQVSTKPNVWKNLKFTEIVL